MENILENRWAGIITDKYVTYYQPQYSNNTGEITGLEALARLNDPSGLLSPAKFIGILERNRLIGKLDSFIFESVCKFIKKCQENYDYTVPIFVNLSYNDFYDKDFISNLEKIRKQYGVDPKNIGIELTDAQVIADRNNAKATIREFHQYGYKVSLDNYAEKGIATDVVKDVRFDTIKLDMRDISDEFDADDKQQISSVVDRAKKSGIEVVAEGVETREQVEFLKSIGCNLAQGYYYSKPVSEEYAMNMLKQTKDDVVAPLTRHKLAEADAYKAKMENLLEQTDIYYWEYIVATKSMYPCPRSIRDFKLNQIVYNCPKSIIDAGAIPREYADQYCDLYKQIDKGAKHAEIVISMANRQDTYFVRCDTTFNKYGEPVSAFCSAVKVMGYHKE